MAPWISLVLMILAGLGLVLRHDMIPVVGFDLGIASAAVGIGGLLMFTGRGDATIEDPAARFAADNRLIHPALVAALAVILFAGYTFTGTVIDAISDTGEQTTTTHTVASEPPPTGRIALRLKRQANGLFLARAQVNGSATQLAVDTGAATVVLNAEDARRAGVDVEALAFTVPVTTSNGTVYTAPTQLNRIFVGPLGAANVAALVAKPGRLEFSLLGMSFLKRLRSYEVRQDHLTLEG